MEDAIVAEVAKLKESEQGAFAVMSMIRVEPSETKDDQLLVKRLYDVITDVAIDFRMSILEKERHIKDLQTQTEIASAADPDAAAAAHAASVAIEAIKKRKAAVACMREVCSSVALAPEFKSASVVLATLLERIYL